MLECIWMLELLECIPLISRQLLESIRQVGLGPAPLSTLQTARRRKDSKQKLLLYPCSLPSQFIGLLLNLQVRNSSHFH